MFDFLTSLGQAIVPDAKAFLGDERWYVARNMIVLLRSVQDRTSLPEITKLSSHPDLRVRLEAIKSLHVFNESVPITVIQDLFNDPDPKVMDAAVTLAANQKIKEAVEPLLRILDGNDVFGARRMIRIKAIRALGEIGEQRALTRIDRFLKASVLPWPSREERHAAWESLKSYPPDAVRGWTERGRRSSDPHVRAISEELEED
jgi:HEAT repeat protein